jgi:LuxR family maltose regulon positive regulatory protein
VPKGSRLALAGQDEPPVQVAQLQAEGRILPLGPADLSLTGEEAATLVRTAGLTLAPGELAELNQRIGGWPAGLYLAALALRAGSPVDEVVGSLAEQASADRGAVAGYLASAYLSRTTAGQREFLTRTAVLDRMSGPLCEAVLGPSGAAATLADLAAANLLVVPLDRLGRWYRYHPLFRDLLLAELDRTEPGLAPELRERAAGWCRDNRLPEEAVEYAMAAGHTGEVARLVAGLSRPGERDDRLAMLQRWYRWLDEQGGIERDPSVAVWAAFLALETGQPADAERWAAAADRGPGNPAAAGDGWAAILRAIVGRHGVAQMQADADQAARTLSAAGLPAPVAALAQALARVASDDSGHGGAYLDQAVSAARQTDAHQVLALALSERALLALARGDWGEGQALAEQAALAVREAGLEDSMAAPLVYALQARMALHRLDPDGARRALVSAQRRRHLLNYAVPVLAVQVRIELIRTYLDLADPAGARTLLREIDELLRQRPDLGTLTGQARALRAELAAGPGALTPGPSALTPGPSALTAAELRLLPLLSAHLSFAEIGAELGRSPSTARSQAASIYRKLGAAGRSQAVARARELGLLDR